MFLFSFRNLRFSAVFSCILLSVIAKCRPILLLFLGKTCCFWLSAMTTNRFINFVIPIFILHCVVMIINPICQMGWLVWVFLSVCQVRVGLILWVFLMGSMFVVNDYRSQWFFRCREWGCSRMVEYRLGGCEPESFHCYLVVILSSMVYYFLFFGCTVYFVYILYWYSYMLIYILASRD